MDNYKFRILQRKLRERRIKRLPRPKKILYPMQIEKEYNAELIRVVERAFALIDKSLVTKLPLLTSQVARERGVKLDSYSDDVANIMASIGLEFEGSYTKDEIDALARKTGKSVDYWNERQLSGSLASVVDFNLFGGEAWLESEISAFALENAKLIKSLPGNFFSDVQDKTLRALGKGTRWEEIAGEIFDTYEVTKSRANLIARDQVGKLQGQLTELRQKDLGIDKYTWRTAGDGKVRESHQANNGKVFAWSNPPATGHPGEEYQCRCYAEPVLSSVLEDL